MKRIIFSIITLLFISINVQSQTDTEFWFSAPEFSQNHGDRPIKFVITAVDAAATVHIYQPALSTSKGGYDTTFTVAYTQTANIDVTHKIETFEAKPSDTILNYGIHITSTSPITCYYENVGFQLGAYSKGPLNSDILSLKGKNALGTSFYIPGQNAFPTRRGIGIAEFQNIKTSFDITATEDNTIVTITPIQDLGRNDTNIRYFANKSFTKILNKGQVYVCEAAHSNNATDAVISHLVGSKIESNKPIVITVVDDSPLLDGWNTRPPYDVVPYNNSVYITYGGRDAQADQIIPIEKTGKEYIAIKGKIYMGATPTSDTITNRPDFIFITGTENNTDITIDGIHQKTIQAGETFLHLLTNKYSHIIATHNIYVWQTTGLGTETGGAIVPSITCTGSTKLGVTRTDSKQSILNIMVKQGSESDYSFNGIFFDSANFTPVPNTDWSISQFSYDTAQIGTTYMIVSTSGEPFHLSVIDGNPYVSGRYTFLSNFSYRKFIRPLVNRPDYEYCEGDTIKLIGNRYEGGIYTWNLPNGKQVIDTFINGHEAYIYQKSKLTLADSGSYSYTIDPIDGIGCTTIIDRMKVNVYANPEVKLPNDTSLCSGKTITLNARGATNSKLLSTTYEWFPTGDTTNSIITNPNPGITTYGVIVTNTYPTITCRSSDSIKVNISEMPTASFDINPNPARGYEPLDVSFINNTAPSTSQYLWKFGDGGTSTETNPTHTFVVQDPNADSVTYDITLIAKISDFCIDSLTIAGIITVLNDPTYEGIINIGKNEIKLHIYPNPATSALTLDNDKKALGNVELFTANGICVFKEDFKQATQITIPISHLPAGTYLLKVNEQVKKVIKH